MKYIFVNLLIFISLFFSGTIKSDEYNTDECIKTLEPLKKYYENTASNIVQECNKRANTHKAWLSSGSPQVILNKDRCEFNGFQGEYPEGCLPNSFDKKITIISIKSATDTRTADVISILDGLKSRGITNVIFEAAE